nr:MAG TPA_asm: hypothetical protein [Caudoviricetes sp.]
MLSVCYADYDPTPRRPESSCLFIIIPLSTDDYSTSSGPRVRK